MHGIIHADDHCLSPMAAIPPTCQLDSGTSRMRSIRMCKCVRCGSLTANVCGRAMSAIPVDRHHCRRDKCTNFVLFVLAHDSQCLRVDGSHPSRNVNLKWPRRDGSSWPRRQPGWAGVGSAAIR